MMLSMGGSSQSGERIAVAQLGRVDDDEVDLVVRPDQGYRPDCCENML
jgi:hypothetical protein